MGKLKWIMLTNYVHERLVKDEDCLRTGLYAWIPTFEGGVQYFQQFDPNDYEKYDIIHVNLSGQDVHILGNIREKIGKNSSTKLVANNDYTVELWQGSFDYHSMMRREFDHADMIFGTEPNQVGTLEVLMKRKIHTIAHPCFVKRLKTLKPKKKLDVISMMSHRYDNYNITPSLAIRDLGYRTRLIGYDSAGDKKKYVTSTCYNAVMSGTNYMDFCEQLMESKVVVDPFTLTSVSRTGWDCAALGVPMVGSDRNYSARICFPKTSVSPFDIRAIREKVKKLLTDDKFRQEVIDYAREKVEMVSYENSRKRYLAALEEGSPKIDI